MLLFFLGLLLVFLASFLAIFSLTWWEINGFLPLGFLISGFILSLVGLPLVLRRSRASSRSQLEYLIIFFLGFPFFLALPFWIYTPFSFIEALFEAVATITLSGYSNLIMDEFPPHLIYFRSLSQWFSGGIMLFLIIPIYGGRKTPSHSFPKELQYLGHLLGEYKIPFLIYSVATIAVYSLLVIFDLELEKSFFYSLGAISTGGFSPYGGSVAALENLAAERIIAMSMFFSLVGYVVYSNITVLFTSKAWRFSYLYFPAFLLIGGFAAGIIFWDNGWDGFFYFASAASTTGYFLDNQVNFMPLIYALTVVGGCYGSLTGGLYINSVAQILMKLRTSSKKALQRRSIPGAIGRDREFLVSYVVAFAISCLALSFSGMDFMEVLDLSLKALSNSAPMERWDPSTISDYQRLVLICSMTLGRLGIVYLAAFFFIFRRDWNGKFWI